MPARHVIVDGSNIATEGNSLPSLKQLDEAVGEFIRENPDDKVTVIVDATFGHRIPSEERERFEQAELDGDLVSPPAGAIGRGDAFLLRVADKVGGVVLSNDSFQEFHGEYEWLFDKGRLIGGKPVPGIGWIFTPRSPVRGPKSRESVKEARRKRRAEQVATEGEEPESGLDRAGEMARKRGGGRKLERAIAVAVEEAVSPEQAGRKRRRHRRGAEPPAEPLNDPLGFIGFITAHELASEVQGTVDEFSSHGAFISAGGARCYLPLSAMGEPPPRSAREVLRRGEERTFIIQAFDPMRRGIELALPGFAHPAGAPTPETIDAEIHEAEVHPGEVEELVEALPAKRGRVRRGAAAPEPAVAALEAAAPEPTEPGVTEPKTARAPRTAGSTRTARAKAVAPPEPVLATTRARRAASGLQPATEAEGMELEAVTTAKKLPTVKKAVRSTKAAAPPTPTKRAPATTAVSPQKQAGRTRATKEAAAPAKATAPKKATAAKTAAAVKVATVKSAAKPRAAAKKVSAKVTVATPRAAASRAPVKTSRSAEKASPTKRSVLAKTTPLAKGTAGPNKKTATRAIAAAVKSAPARKVAATKSGSSPGPAKTRGAAAAKKAAASKTAQVSKKAVAGKVRASARTGV